METANDYMMQFLGGAHQLLTPGLVLASLGLSFLLAALIAIVYQLTFRGFTYSRTYVQSLILGSIVTCMLIMAIGSNFARGLGILGTLAIIRFRVPVHDPRDGMFIFASLGAGIACAVVVVAAWILNLLVLLSWWILCIIAFLVVLGI